MVREEEYKIQLPTKAEIEEDLEHASKYIHKSSKDIAAKISKLTAEIEDFVEEEIREFVEELD